MHLTSNSNISRRAFLAGTGVMAFDLSGCAQTGNTAQQPNQQPNEQAGSTSQRTDAEKVPESSNNATSDDEGLVDGKLAVFDLHSDTLGRREMQDSECWQNFLVSIGFDPSSEAGDLRQNKGALDLTRMQ